MDDDHNVKSLFVVVLTRKFWSSENFGPGDKNSWKIGPPDHNFLKNFGLRVE